MRFTNAFEMNPAWVEALVNSGEADSACRLLADAGYTVTYTISLCRVYGVPQERVRVWFVGVRTDKLVDAGLDLEWLQLTVKTLFEGLRYNRRHTCSDLVGHLLPEWHPRVVTMMQSAIEKASAATCLDGDASMRRKHRVEARHGCGSFWHSGLLDSYPAYAHTSERMRLLLDERGVRFPEASARVLNLSQSGASDLNMVSPTITPKGEFWIAHLCRPMLGDECMNLQWLYLSDIQKSTYLSSFLADLAGNSFCVADCSAAVVVTLAVFSLVHGARLEVLLRKAQLSARLSADAAPPPADQGRQGSMQKRARHQRGPVASFDSGSSSDSSFDWT